MNEGESIECIASGTGWCACVTDSNFLRIFSQEGVQKQVLSQSSMIVTMTGYENLLVIVYHAGLPIYDHQQLKFKIIDCGGLQLKTSDTLY
jgi:chromosome transmission fidelity protein 4